MAEDTIRNTDTRIAQVEADLAIRTSTRGEAFTMMVGDRGEKGDVYVSVWLDWTGHEQMVEITDELTPLGLISRLEYMLDRFEADLAV